MGENIFREALNILHNHRGNYLLLFPGHFITAAMIPLNTLPEFGDKTVCQGLEELARIVEEAKQNGAISRRNKMRAMPTVR